MYCQKCGTENPEEARFCKSCGNPFDVASIKVSGKKKLPGFYNYSEEKHKSRVILWTLVGIIYLPVFGLGFIFLSIADQLRKIRKFSFDIESDHEQALLLDDVIKGVKAYKVLLTNTGIKMMGADESLRMDAVLADDISDVKYSRTVLKVFLKNGHKEVLKVTNPKRWYDLIDKLNN